MAALDAVVFVGDRPVDLWGEHHGGSADDQRRLRQQLDLVADAADDGRQDRDMFVYESVAAASVFLSRYLRAGDLVLLKGSGPADHLERIALSRHQTVSCWRRHCGRMNSCDGCELLTTPGDDACGDVACDP